MAALPQSAPLRGLALRTASFGENLAAAGCHLARFASAPVRHLIGGETAASASQETFANVSPIDGMHLAEVAAGDWADVAAAAAAASPVVATPVVARQTPPVPCPPVPTRCPNRHIHSGNSLEL